MDSRVSEDKESHQLRRSTRKSSVFTVEPTPRGPLKRTRKELKKQAPVRAVNGSGDMENGSDDEESPGKKGRAETDRPVDGGGDENEMDVGEEDLERNEDQEMDVLQDSSYGTHRPTTCHVKPSTKEPVASTKSAAQIRPPANRNNVSVTSMADYKKTMEAKAQSTGIPTVNHRVPSVYPASEKPYTTRQRVNNVPTEKETAQYKKQGIKKTAVIKKSSGYSCRGFMWCLWRLVLLALLCSALLLAYKFIPVLKKTAAVNPEMFADRLSLLETQFPSQRPELWRMSKIHLEKHLKTAHPTEPVSLIFTAGHRAERTLHCLAQRLASSFSSALNASVLHIDGASKASQDSDEVKLDIDSQLRAAFEGDKPVAVIHRFEELPPSSTLIFYRYCDHESAAYKRVFLLFTVLLPQDEVKPDQSLKDLEEMVHDYVKERLVDSSNQAGFSDMDLDKYGGLWSRISHLILPVVSEKEVEQKGC
ncbi:torsin-1A-interacting protein 1-like isoform X2 [Anarhichas minor]|uniref:torsin-1A-interacting protein 1-like isoform X2 n=1 Tax=Anarhichas minor TaxID=65739 RepID=UPI003F73BDAC